MEINGIGVNFGMALVKTKQAERLINRLPYDKAMQIEVMEMNSKHNPIDVFVSTFEKHGKEKIKAEVGVKTFKEGLFTSPVKAIRKAVEYANKYNEEQQAAYLLTKDMTRPVLK